MSAINPEEFLRLVWPDEGPYVVASRATKPDGAPLFRNSVVYSAAQAIEFSDSIMGDEKLQTYFAYGQFREGSVSTYKGKSTTNVVAQRCLYFDIDTNRTKPDDKELYRTQKEAADAVNEFCADYKLPVPLLNDSGGGLHGNFPLIEQLSPAEWSKLALLLKARMHDAGVKADSMCTANVVQYMRVPGSFNRSKHLPNPRMVRTLNLQMIERVPAALMTERLSKGKPVVSLPADVPAKVADKVEGFDAEVRPEGITDALINSIEDVALQFAINNPQPLTVILSSCAVSRHIYDNINTMPWQHWFPLMRLIKFTKDGEAAAAELGSGSPNYKPSANAASARGTLKPAACRAIAKGLEHLCKGCPGEGLDSSPLQSPNWVGTKVIEIRPEAVGDGSGLLPVRAFGDFVKNDKFYEKRLGWIYRKEYVKDDVTVPEMRVMKAELQPLMVVRTKVSDSEVLTELMFRQLNTYDKHSIFYIPMDYVAARTVEMVAKLSHNGHVITNQEEVGAVRAVMKHWHEQMQRTGNVMNKTTQLGWAEMDGSPASFGKVHTPKVFHMPEYSIYQNEVRESVFDGTKVESLSKEYFRPTGTLKGWTDAMDQFAGPGKERLALLSLSSFASILAPIGGAEVAMVIANDARGGTGKTSAMMMSASAFSTPREGAGLMISGNATLTAITNTCSVAGNLGLGINEVQINPRFTIEQFATLVMDVSNGAGHTRALPGGKQIKNPDFRLLMAVTSNVDLFGQVQALGKGATSKLLRMFVIKLQRTGALRDDMKSKLDPTLMGNHALIGRLYLEYLVRHQDKLAARYWKTREWVQERFKFGDGEGERIWCNTMTLYCMALRILIKLGVCSYDEEAIHEEIRQLVTENRLTMREDSAEMEPAQALLYLLNSYHPHFPRTVEDRAQQSSSEIRYPIMGKIVDDVLFLSDKALKDLRLDLGYGKTEFFRFLMEQGYPEVPRRTSFLASDDKKQDTRVNGYRFELSELQRAAGIKPDESGQEHAPLVRSAVHKASKLH